MSRRAVRAPAEDGNVAWPPSRTARLTLAVTIDGKVAQPRIAGRVDVAVRRRHHAPPALRAASQGG